MRERAVAVGGDLRTGRAAAGGFLIEATLPADVEVPG
jgi:signal transduction histidine kinase